MTDSFRVVDTDGEFLLIEAAHALPKWLSPEVADNRVCAAPISLFPRDGSLYPRGCCVAEFHVNCRDGFSH